MRDCHWIAILAVHAHGSEVEQVLLDPSVAEQVMLVTWPVACGNPVSGRFWPVLFNPMMVRCQLWTLANWAPVAVVETADALT